MTAKTGTFALRLPLPLKAAIEKAPARLSRRKLGTGKPAHCNILALRCKLLP